MKVGITFGAFCPLHQGHLDMIMRAKKENDICFVFVAGYDDDRGGKLLPLRQRYIIISNFLKSENVKVEFINDTELGLDESFSDKNWETWLNFAYLRIRQLGYDLRYQHQTTWYVSEPEYKDQIMRCGGCLDLNCTVLDRNVTPVSGTYCRTNPLKNWSYITAPFRCYFSHNILISGTASEGKTTLVQDIGKYFNLPYSYEKGRDNCEFKADNDFNVRDFIYNIYEQNKYNKELISSPQNPRVFISDTDNIVTLMYAKAYADKPEFVLTKNDYDLLFKITEAYEEKTKWDKIFILKPAEKGIADDGQRYMPDSDYSIRLKYFEILTSLYDEFGYEYEILPGGDYYGNFLRVKDYIRGLYE